MKQKLARPVKVVGTSSLGQKSFDDPEYQDISIYELWACAMHEAMEDAGISPKEIQKINYAHMANFSTCGNIMAPVGFLEEWAGVKGAAMCHIEQACASGYVAFTEAVNAVASGKYEIVMCAGLESPKHFIPFDQPAFIKKPISEYPGFWHPGEAIFDNAYSRFDGVSNNLLTEEHGKYYIKKYGISEETLDDAYNAMAVNLRHNAHGNERALTRKLFEDIAKEKGYEDVMEYMKSDNNPHITQYVRKTGSLLHNVCAGAIVLCSEEAAERLREKNGKDPITIVDYASMTNTQRRPFCFHEMNVQVARELAENNPEYDPKDLDLLITTVMTSGEQMDSAEEFGYLPFGEGYKYELEGETRYNGKRPINPHGGDLSYGHGFACSGVNMIGEALHQMWGRGGESQVPGEVKKVLVRGMGGGHTTVGIILENQN